MKHYIFRLIFTLFFVVASLQNVQCMEAGIAALQQEVLSSSKNLWAHVLQSNPALMRGRPDLASFAGVVAPQTKSRLQQNLDQVKKGVALARQKISSLSPQIKHLCRNFNISREVERVIRQNAAVLKKEHDVLFVEVVELEKQLGVVKEKNEQLAGLMQKKQTAIDSLSGGWNSACESLKKALSEKDLLESKKASLNGHIQTMKEQVVKFKAYVAEKKEQLVGQ